MYKSLIPQQVSQALLEDLNNQDASADITAQLIPVDAKASGKVITRQDAVICGVEWVNETCKQVDKNILITWLVQDGDKVKANQT